MLECRSMIDAIGTVAFEYLAEQGFVGNIAEHRNVSSAGRRTELGVDFVEILFGIVEQDQQLRMQSRLERSRARSRCILRRRSPKWSYPSG
jgi:hypothetical protein